MKIVTRLLFLFLSVIAVSCDHGLKPPEVEINKTGLSGTIYYSNWPPADSIVLLKIVFFKTFPPSNILQEVLSNNAKTYPVALDESLPINENSTYYEIELGAETYEYIVVAQQFGPDYLTDWRAVGQYNSVPGDSLPSPVSIIQDSLLRNIDIYVDFNDPPVQYIEAE